MFVFLPQDLPMPCLSMPRLSATRPGQVRDQGHQLYLGAVAMYRLLPCRVPLLLV